MDWTGKFKEQNSLVNKGIAGPLSTRIDFKAVTGRVLESGISPYATVDSTGQYRYGEGMDLGFA